MDDSNSKQPLSADDYCRMAQLTKSTGFFRLLPSPAESSIANISPVHDPALADILHGVMGLQTEIGEVADPLKKFLFYGKGIDTDHMLEEIGDIHWYLAILLAGVNALRERHDLAAISMNDVLQNNISKLRRRYGEKFNRQGALSR